MSKEVRSNAGYFVKAQDVECIERSGSWYNMIITDSHPVYGIRVMYDRDNGKTRVIKYLLGTDKYLDGSESEDTFIDLDADDVRKLLQAGGYSYVSNVHEEYQKRLLKEFADII